jgi:diguanylate cyclase (GGDEF)-like protein
VGDQVLQQFAFSVDSLIRKSDYLIRWGGEEFVVICPGTPLESAERLAEKIRRTLESSSWPMDIPLTASLGVTTLGAEPISASLKRADTALYAAKGRGRNRVTSLPPPSMEAEEDYGMLGML